MPMTRIAISAQHFEKWHVQISGICSRRLKSIFRYRRRLFSAFDCYSPQQRVFDPDYLCGAEGSRSDDYLLFQITAGKARSPHQKQAFIKI